MGNQTFCHCNKANESDELNTETEAKKVKSKNMFIAQKVEEWSLNVNENIEKSCSKLPRQTLLENKIRNEKLNEINEKVEGLVSIPLAVNDKNFTFKTDEFDGGIRTEDEEQPCDYKIIPCKETKYVKSKNLENFNQGVDYEEDIPYIYNKPRVSDKKNSFLNQSLQQSGNKDFNLEKNQKQTNVKIEEEDKNFESEKKNDIDSHDNIYTKKKHFNRSGEAIFYKTYDDKSTEGINEIELQNINDNFRQFNTTEPNNENAIELLNENFGTNHVYDDQNMNIQETTKKFQSELSSCINFQNNLNQNAKPERFHHNTKNIDISNDKIVYTDPIYIENESKIELENNYDSIDNISLGKTKMDKSKGNFQHNLVDKETTTAEKEKLDISKHYRQSSNNLSVRAENNLVTSNDSKDTT